LLAENWVVDCEMLDLLSLLTVVEVDVKAVLLFVSFSFLLFIKAGSTGTAIFYKFVIFHLFKYDHSRL
jgi:hypothetical protein